MGRWPDVRKPLEIALWIIGLILLWLIARGPGR